MKKHPYDDEIVENGKTLGQLRIEAYHRMTDDDLPQIKRMKARREFNRLNKYRGAESAGKSRVICTELVRQGRMDRELQKLDAAFTLSHLSLLTVRGYHVWAVPYVRLMQRSQLATRIAEPIARWRAQEIAYLMGAHDRPNLKGKLVRMAGEPACWLVGGFLSLMPYARNAQAT